MNNWNAVTSAAGQEPRLFLFQTESCDGYSSQVSQNHLHRVLWAQMKTIGSRLSFASCCSRESDHASIGAGSGCNATAAKRRKATCFHCAHKLEAMPADL